MPMKMGVTPLNQAVSRARHCAEAESPEYPTQGVRSKTGVEGQADLLIAESVRMVQLGCSLRGVRDDTASKDDYNLESSPDRCTAVSLQESCQRLAPRSASASGFKGVKAPVTAGLELR